jgi:hypothetical protein
MCGEPAFTVIRKSASQLVGALRMEQDEVWTTGKRYFDTAARCRRREHQP